MKWFISTFLLLFNTLIAPNVGPPPVSEEKPLPEPPSICVPAPEQEAEPANTRLYVLMYHHFVPEGTPCNAWMVTDTRFREDLEWMAGHGWTTVLPSQLANREPLPEKAVLLTFDDGYGSNYTLAYPLLQEFQAKAVISVIAGYVDDPALDYLTWDMCREMAQSGLVEIGSHTYRCHEGETGIRRLKGESRADYEARVLSDLQTSISLIEENVGTAPLFFAYPNGLTDKWASAFIREHFAVTAITRHGAWDISDGLYGMKRCNVEMGKPVSKLLPS